MKRRVRLLSLWLVCASLFAFACGAALAQSDAPFHEPVPGHAPARSASTPASMYRVGGVMIGVRRAAALNDDSGATHVVTLGERLPDGYRVQRINLRSVVLVAGRRRLTLRVPR